MKIRRSTQKKTPISTSLQTQNILQYWYQIFIFFFYSKFITRDNKAQQMNEWRRRRNGWREKEKKETHDIWYKKIKMPYFINLVNIKTRSNNIPNNVYSEVFKYDMFFFINSTWRCVNIRQTNKQTDRETVRQIV